MKQIVGLVLILCCTQMVAQEVFPDGKAIPEWFRENKEVNVNALGKKYSITSYGVVNDSIQSPNQKIPDRKTKCVIKTHINIKQNVIFSAKLKPV